MIDFFVFAIAIFAIGLALAGFQAAAHTLTVEVTCTCGAVRRSITVVDTIDALRFAEALTEGCPRCRSNPPCLCQHGRQESAIRKESGSC